MDFTKLSKFLSGAMSYKEASAVMMILGGDTSLPDPEAIEALTNAEEAIKTQYEEVLKATLEARERIASSKMAKV